MKEKTKKTNPRTLKIGDREVVLSAEDVSRAEEILNRIFFALDVPASKRGAFFANKYALNAAKERVDQSGYTETIRVLDTYLRGVKSHALYRPSFTTAAKVLTTGWPKVVAFVDSFVGKSNGRIPLSDQTLRNEIADGLSRGT